MYSIDLHIHTTASDGKMSPQDIVAAAVKARLTHIAITDHDTISGLNSLQQTDFPVNKKLSVIPGIELSTDLDHCEVHILGYYIDIRNYQLNERLNHLTQSRLSRVHQMLEKLNNLGYKVTFEEIIKLAGKENKAVGRPHVARALIERGYFTKVSDVFNKLLHNNGPVYVPHYKLELAEIIELVTNAGGIAVLAHPGLIGNESIVEDIITAGIQGLEVYHPEHDAMQIEKYLHLANKKHLIVTGGSDFHGLPGRFPEQLGVFKVPASLLDELKKKLV